MPKVLTLLRHNIKNVKNKIRVISLARLSPTVPSKICSLKKKFYKTSKIGVSDNYGYKMNEQLLRHNKIKRTQYDTECSAEPNACARIRCECSNIVCKLFSIRHRIYSP